MDNMMLAFNSVFPLLFMIVVGVFIKKINMVDKHTLDQMNNVVFKVFLSALIFLNVYNLRGKDIFTSENMKLVGLAAASVIALVVIFMAMFYKVIPDQKRRTIVVQGLYRSNLVLFGIPLVLSIYKDSDLSAISMLITVVVPLYNVIAVILLDRAVGKKTSLVKTFIDVFKNPLVCGSLLGVFLWAIKFEVPGFILNPIESMSKVATPLAFIVLGASLKLGSIKKNLKTISVVCFIKLIIIPLVIIGIAYSMGFRGEFLIALLGVFGSPAAVASFSMAKAADVEPDLAGELVAMTCLCSIVTIFGWILYLSNNNLI